MNETMLLAADSLTPFEGEKQEAAPLAIPSKAATETAMKICPVCRAQVFADMDTCFNCMYLFGSNQALEQKAAARGLPGAADVHAAPRVRDSLHQGTGAVRSLSGSDALSRTCDDNALMTELLVELHGFLGQFLLDRGIDVKQL